jgi:hypothetical protein
VINAIMGGILGPAGRAAGAAAQPLVEAPQAAVQRQMQQAYAPLSDLLHSKRQLDQAFAPVAADITAYGGKVAKQTMAEVGRLSSLGAVSGEDLQNSYRTLGQIANSPSTKQLDQNAARAYQSAVQSVMENTAPMSAQTGQLAPVGATWAAKQAGDVFSGQLKDLQRLKAMQNVANVPLGPSVPSQASAFIRSDLGKRVAPAGSPQYQNYFNLAGTPTPVTPNLTPNAYDIRHVISPIVGHALGGAALMAGGGIYAGQDPSRIAEEAALGALGGGIEAYGTHRLLPALQAPAQRRALQQAIDNARAGFSMGNVQQPVAASSPLPGAVRNLLFGYGASGNLPGM